MDYFIAAAYVDDILMIGKEEAIRKYKEEIGKKFKMKFTPSFTSFLGSRVVVDQTGISLSQKKKKVELLASMRISECKSSKAPLPARTDLGMISAESSDDEPAPIGYRTVIGSLNHISNFTRPDISYAVSQLSKALENPTDHYWRMVKRVLRYLSGTSSWVLKMEKLGEVSEESKQRNQKRNEENQKEI
ncbi:MAG: reverse transcriptase domain-containing protein [Bacteroidota bacterium]